MTAGLSREEMEAILLEHEIAELEQDVERTMATLCDEPRYEFPAFGVAILGTDAVRATYNRILGEVVEVNLAAEARVLAVDTNTMVREAVVSFDKPDGSRVSGTYSVVMSFDSDTKTIAGERMYMDTNFAEHMRRVLGEDFFTNTPGVVPLSGVLPNIERHDAFAAAEAQGLSINHPQGTPAHA